MTERECLIDQQMLQQAVDAIERLDSYVAHIEGNERQYGGLVNNLYNSLQGSKPVSQVDFGTKAYDKCGYHVSVIPKGVLGETSKIREELNELEDAMQQGSLVMAAVEVSDLIGAVSSFLDKHLKPIKLEDVVLFSKITERAFTNGHRKSD